jgi:hypothetical protein
MATSHNCHHYHVGANKDTVFCATINHEAPSKDENGIGAFGAILIVIIIFIILTSILPLIK